MNDETIICTCMNVSIGDIRRAVAAGADSFAAVQEITGVSTICGLCIDNTIECVDKILKETKR